MGKKRNRRLQEIAAGLGEYWMGSKFRDRPEWYVGPTPNTHDFPIPDTSTFEPQTTHYVSSDGWKEAPPIPKMGQGSVYLGGPVKNVEPSAAAAWRDYVTGMLSQGIQVINPLWMKNKSWIGEMCFARLRQADVVLFNFIAAPEVSQGSLIEFGFAVALNKPIVVANDSDTHESDLLWGASAMQFGSLDDAVACVNSLLEI